MSRLERRKASRFRPMLIPLPITRSARKPGYRHAGTSIGSFLVPSRSRATAGPRAEDHRRPDTGSRTHRSGPGRTHPADHRPGEDAGPQRLDRGRPRRGARARLLGSGAGGARNRCRDRGAGAGTGNRADRADRRVAAGRRCDDGEGGRRAPGRSLAHRSRPMPPGSTRRTALRPAASSPSTSIGKPRRNRSSRACGSRRRTGHAPAWCS
jgi:hypothetical protein